MLSPQRCPKCHSPLGVKTAPQLCPSCVLEAALGLGDESAFGDEDELPKARLFGDYEIIEQLARGGMGVVYRARQIKLRREVALKLITSGAFASGEALRRFQAEAELAAGFKHPNIVPIFEIGEVDGQPFFSMGLVEGPPLDQKLGRKPLEPKAAAGLLVKIARAVQYAHDRGVLHRDLKPANILMDAQGEPHLTDFGLAKVMQQQSALTCTNAILGTPSYMAPEQARGDVKSLAVTVDVYGLGAVLYDVLTGEPPFAGGTTYETVRRVLETEPRRPSVLNAAVDGDLETICLKSLEKQPERRYASAAAFAEDLERWLGGRPIQARAVGAVERATKWARRHPLVAALGCLSVAALLVGAVGITWQWRRAEKKSIEAAREQERAEREQYFSSVAAAQQFLKEGAVERARDALLSTRRELRHWEWGRLMLLCQQEAWVVPAPTKRPAVGPADIGIAQATGRVLTTFGGASTLCEMSSSSARQLNLKEDEMLSATFSPDEQVIAGATVAGEIVVWDAATLRELARLNRSPTRLESLSFSPDNSRVVAGAADGSVLIWDRRTKQWLRDMGTKARGRSEPVFSGDSGRVLSSLAGTEITAWDAEKGIELWREHAPDLQGSVMASLDGETVATASPTTGITIRKSGKLTAHINPQVQLSQIHLSGNGRRLLTIDQRERLTLWNAETGDEIEMWPERTYFISESRDSRYFASCGDFRYSRIRELQTGREVLTASVTPDYWNPAFSPEARLFAAEMPDRSIKVWLLDDSATFLLREGTEELRSVPERMQKIAFSPGGERIAAAHMDRQVTIWDAHTGALLHHLHGHLQWVADVAWSPDGAWLASAGADNRVILWDAQTGQSKFILVGHTGPVESVAFRPNSKEVVSCGLDGRAIVWEVENGRRLAEADLRPPARTVAWSPDGRRIAVGGQGPALLLDARLTNPIALPASNVWTVSFSRSGTTLALGSFADQFITLWSVAEGKVTARMRSRALPLNLSFSPDDRRLAAACSERLTGMGFPSLELWDVAERRLAVEFPSPPGQALSVAFTSTGKTLALGHSRGSLELLDAFPWDGRDYGTDDYGIREIEQYQARYWRARLGRATAPQEKEPIAWQPPRSCWSVRGADTPVAALDLTAFYNGTLEIAWNPVPGRDYLSQSFSSMPVGRRNFGGVEFDVRGVIQLATGAHEWEKLFPKSVSIPLPSNVRKLALLQGALGTPEHERRIGEYRIVYRDGSTASFPIELGTNVVPSWLTSEERLLAVPQADLVWKESLSPGYGEAMRRGKATFGALYVMALENPHPEKPVSSLEFVSAAELAAPFLVAVTVEP